MMSAKEIANVWFKKMTTVVLTKEQRDEYSAMCVENGVIEAEVDKEVHTMLLKEDGLDVDVIMELTEKYADTILEADRTDNMSLIDPMIMECVSLSINPMDIVLMADSVLAIRNKKGDK